MDIETKKLWLKMTIYIILYLAIMIASAIFIIPISMPAGLIIWIFIISIGTYLIIRWHAKNTVFICPKCNHKFTITTTKDFLSPHFFDKKLLRCPDCGESSWCKAISAKSIQVDISRAERYKQAKTKPAKSLYIQMGIVLFLYLILWGNAFYLYAKLPDTVPTHFDIAGKPDAWGAKSSFFFLPLSATIFPLLHGLFCLYAVKEGYKSLIYPAITIIFIITLLIFIGIQYSIFSQAI
jgi:transcription elongation factor Elf1